MRECKLKQFLNCPCKSLHGIYMTNKKMILVGFYQLIRQMNIIYATNVIHATKSKTNKLQYTRGGKWLSTNNLLLIFYL